MSQNRKNSTPDQFLGLNFGSDLQNMLLHNSKDQIFDILIFCREMAPFPRKNSQFWDFRLFFVGLSQNLALEIDLESSFCDFETFFKNKNLVF